MNTALTSNNFLDDLLTYFQDKCLDGLNYLLPEALYLVWLLGIILICLQLFTQGYIFGSGSLPRLLITVLKIGAFIFIVTNWEEIAIDILFKSFEVAGQTASAYTDQISPAKILMRGFILTKEILAGVWMATITGSIFLTLAKLAMCLAIIAAFAYIAISVFLVNIQFYIAAALSVILLPFGMILYLKYLFDNVVAAMFSFGVHYMATIFLLGLGSTIFSSWNTALGVDTPPMELMKAVIGVAIWCILCLKIPEKISGMIASAAQDSGAQMAAGAVGGAAAFAARTTGGMAWRATRGLRQSAMRTARGGGRAMMGMAGRAAGHTAKSLRNIGTMFR